VYTVNLITEVLEREVDFPTARVNAESCMIDLIARSASIRDTMINFISK